MHDAIEWLKKNWLFVLLGVGGIVATYFAYEWAQQNAATNAANNTAAEQAATSAAEQTAAQNQSLGAIGGGGTAGSSSGSGTGLINVLPSPQATTPLTTPTTTAVASTPGSEGTTGGTATGASTTGSISSGQNSLNLSNNGTTPVSANGTPISIGLGLVNSNTGNLAGVTSGTGYSASQISSIVGAQVTANGGNPPAGAPSDVQFDVANGQWYSPSTGGYYAAPLTNTFAASLENGSPAETEYESSAGSTVVSNPTTSTTSGVGGTPGSVVQTSPLSATGALERPLLSQSPTATPVGAIGAANPVAAAQQHSANLATITGQLGTTVGVGNPTFTPVGPATPTSTISAKPTSSNPGLPGARSLT